ncbi:MAG: DNA repair protein RadC [Candidatus Sumerlaeia bacterium]|nr:DNA repair protein RadC [Candidatus Sumerlaeia bacterium]
MEDLPVETPAERREIRLRAKALADEHNGLDWVASDRFVAELNGVPGPVSATSLVRRKVSGLTPARAARFLLLIGFEIALPSTATQRFLQRLGLLEKVDTSVRGRDKTIQTLGDLAVSSGTPLRELHFTVEAFTIGNNGTAVCGRDPECGRCPARQYCPTGRSYDQLGVAGKSSPAKKLTEVYAPEELPREKLQRLGPEGLSNAELLAILLRKGNGKLHAVALANHLLKEEVTGGFERLPQLTISELQNLGGVGQVQAITIKAALELARRLTAPTEADTERLTSSRIIFNRLRNLFLHQKTEVFMIVLVNSKNEVLRQVEISRGTLTQSLVHPREAFQLAIRESANAVIFVHNHPSGDPTPSRQDKIITKRLVEAGELLGIRVLDHLVIGRDTYYSFSDEGDLTPD